MSKKLQWISVGILLVIAVLFFVIFKPVTVGGSAMEPSYKNDVNYLVNKLAFIGSPPVRGDVVTFQYTQNPKYAGISRIIGVPEDKLIIQNGKVSVNGAVLEESYIASGVITQTSARSEIKDINDGTGMIEDINAPKILDEGQEITVPENSYFMMGDNREESVDSRSLGFVDRKDIFGKVAFQYKLPF